MKKIETIWQLLFFIKKQISINNNENNAFIDALSICEYISKKSKNFIIVYGNDYKIDFAIKHKALKILKRLKKQEPLSYILKHCIFYGIKFHINNNVLIPRTDTENLVDYIIKYKNTNEKINVLDLCCGCGCIGLTLTKFLNCNVIGVDIMQKALRLAKFNAKNLNLENKIKFLNFDILKQNFDSDLKFDIIVSNPPYIGYDECIENSVVNFEPNVALFAKDNGLIFYKHIIKHYKHNMKKNGLLIFECGGYLQSKIIAEIFTINDFHNIKIIKDLSNINRIVAANLK